MEPKTWGSSSDTVTGLWVLFDFSKPSHLVSRMETVPGYKESEVILYNRPL